MSTAEPKKKFTPAEVQAILAELDAGTALTHEIADRYTCDPSDIWALWDERSRVKQVARQTGASRAARTVSTSGPESADG